MTLLTSVEPISSTQTGIGAGALFGIWLAAYLISSLGLMGVFVKAGEAGWQGFVPIWNTLVLIKIAGKPLWWFILLLIPIVNIVAVIVIWYGLSRSFGHDVGFTLGLVFLPVIFLWILWLGSSRYIGPGGAQAVGYASV